MIGYYVHHHGRGHLTRALLVAAHLDGPVTVLSSLPAPPACPPGLAWHPLTRDDEVPLGHDPQAGGALHFAPLANPGYRRRMQQVAAWLVAERPSAMVVDVSVEVATLCRLLGVEVVSVVGPGRRADAPHRLGREVSSLLLAPWPAGLMASPDGVLHVGAFSRFDTRTPRAVSGGRRGVVLLGAGGVDGDPAALPAAVPGWDWRVLDDPTDPSVDVWAELQAADVVVCHAGQSSVAEVAAARRPAVVVAQQRPFAEQATTARALDAAGLAVGVPGWPSAEQWPRLLTRALALDPAGWSRWNDGQGARRAAAAITAVVAA